MRAGQAAAAPGRPPVARQPLPTPTQAWQVLLKRRPRTIWRRTPPLCDLRRHRTMSGETRCLEQKGWRESLGRDSNGWWIDRSLASAGSRRLLGFPLGQGRVVTDTLKLCYIENRLSTREEQSSVQLVLLLPISMLIRVVFVLHSYHTHCSPMEHHQHSTLRGIRDFRRMNTTQRIRHHGRRRSNV